ncbi:MULTISPECIES: TonB C-terminal domain-containing protein [unclassified Thioalkalivibrio]|uniref:TonB C-terminal domain-containing protein n=1 Tax=unclassified Thioalkalivibrio TaxID=2621013 RepID=UPI000378CE40|nr:MULTISPECIES: TonB C-terminal domain-containing protein [unclassified Thioalkalivibrio]
MGVERLSSIFFVLTMLLITAGAPAMAALPQGAWLDLLELRADQAMDAGDYAEVMHVLELYRRADGEPGIKLRAQEIVAKARHSGDPGSAFVPLGELIAEAGPQHPFYRSALELYAELEREAPHPHYRPPAHEQAERKAGEQLRPERRLETQRRLDALGPERDTAERQAQQHREMNQWRTQVQSVIQRRWHQPSGLDPSSRSIVRVHANESGEITNFEIESCSGGSAFCESVWETMARLSSLPRPPDADAVRDGLRIRFEPKR